MHDSLQDPKKSEGTLWFILACSSVSLAITNQSWVQGVFSFILIALFAVRSTASTNIKIVSALVFCMCAILPSAYQLGSHDGARDRTINFQKGQ